MMTYLVGGENHGTVVRDYGPHIEMLTPSGGVELYRRAYAQTSDGYSFGFHVHSSMHADVERWPAALNSQSILDRAYGAIQTHFHNERAGRV